MTHIATGKPQFDKRLVLKINGVRSCYVGTPDGQRIRISKARTVRGELQGRTVLGASGSWVVIPRGSKIELFN